MVSLKTDDTLQGLRYVVFSLSTIFKFKGFCAKNYRQDEVISVKAFQTEDLAAATTAAPTDTTTEAVGRKIRKIRKTLNAVQPARSRRQDESGGGLADLGICLGDILPAIREKYPNKNLNVQVTPTRAPSIIFKDGGCFLYIDQFSN